MFRKIGRSFKEAFWGITHHVAMVISTAIAVTITLVLVSVLSLLIANPSLTDCFASSNKPDL